MPASSSDFFQKVGDPGSATTLSAPGYTIGDTSINVGSTANWPSDTGITIAIDEAEVVDGVEVRVDGTYNEYRCVVATGTSANQLVWARGDGNRNYAAGALTRVYIPISAERENRLVEGILEHADQDGTLKAGAVDNTSVIGSGVVTQTNLHEKMPEYTFDFIASGCVWSGDAYGSTRNASCSSGVVYLNGVRLTVAAVVARSFTASKDVYCDLHDNGDGTAVWVYTDTTTNAASPALTAGNLRGGIIVVGASNIANAAAVNQGQEDRVLPIASSVPYAVTDSLGNLIAPRDPNRKILGYRQRTISFTTTSTTPVQVTELSCPVKVPTGRKVKLTLSTGYASQNTGGSYAEPSIWEGAVVSGTKIGQWSFRAYTPGALTPFYVSTQPVLPSSASVTYNAGLNAAVSGNAGLEIYGPGTVAFLMVELA